MEPAAGDVHVDRPLGWDGKGKKKPKPDDEAHVVKADALKSDGEGLSLSIFKSDDEQRMVYGWASVISENGEAVVDTQGDVIEPEELMKATTDFMLESRLGLTMHKRDKDGLVNEEHRTMSLVHSLPVTAELAKALGIETEREGWIVGCKVHDDATWADVKADKLAAFSIGARAERVDIGELPPRETTKRKPQMKPVIDEDEDDQYRAPVRKNGEAQSAISGGINVHVHMPKIDIPAIHMPNVTIDKIEASMPPLTLNVPEQPAPQITVAPNITVEAPKARDKITEVLEHDAKGRIMKTMTKEV